MMIGDDLHMDDLREEVAVQLFSVRDAIQADLETSLNRLSRLGFRGVELAGWAGSRPERWSHLLLQNRLTPVAMHIPFDDLDHDVERVVAEAEMIGCPVMVLPWIGEEKRRTPADWSKTAAWMNRIGESIRRQGKRFGYHNHAFEFDHLESGETGYDRLIAETDPALVEFELDIFWAAKAEQNVPELVSRLGTRLTFCHIKDMTGDQERTFAPVGHGILPWSEWLPMLKVQALIVEQDACKDPDPFNCLKASIDFLQSKPESE
ncbi:MAG: sugar phosphate isomerase/epimerase [Firmicutes bacterium]|jgi:sugar phosphate isomerase/epimerase|nr:sugar phosphate isomerase/epimerase [Bacillota bacterium]